MESSAIGGAAYWSNMEILEYLMLWCEQEEKREYEQWEKEKEERQ